MNVKNLPYLILFLLLIFAFYFETIKVLISIWTDSYISSYNHGLFVFLIIVFFCLQKLRQYKFNFYFSLYKPAILAVLLSSSLWLISDIGNIQIGQLLSLYILLISIILSVSGYKQFKNYFFPLVLLIFTIPVWDHLNIYLRMLSTWGVKYFLSLTDILFLVEGFHITLTNGKFHVDRGCSGLNQFISGLTLASLYCYIENIKMRYSIFFVMAAALLTISSNIVRIFTIVIAGYFTDMQHYFVTTDHVMLGWVLFMFFFVFYLYVCNRIVSKYSGKICNQGQDNLDSNNANKTKVTKTSFAILFVFAISGPSVSYAIKNKSIDNLKPMSVPDCIETWCLTDESGSVNLDYQFIGSDKIETYWFNNGSEKIRLDIIRYKEQDQGKEAINEKNYYYNKDIWSFKKSIKSTGKFIKLPDSQVLLTQKLDEALYKSWFLINNKHIINPAYAKLENIIALLSGNPEVAIIILSAHSGANTEQKDKQLDMLAKTLFEKLK